MFLPQAHFVCVHSFYGVKLPILPPASQTEAEEGFSPLSVLGRDFECVSPEQLLSWHLVHAECLAVWHFSLVPHFLFVSVADFFI